MSTKHNCPHPERGRSNYRARLKRRGLSKAPPLMQVEPLRKTQERRVEETCTLGLDHRSHECDGAPWWPGYETESESA